MSKTELEEDLRATFERAAASVPPAADLTARATTGAKRAQRRTWIASGGAAAAVAVVVAVGFSVSGGGPAASPEPAASTPAPATSAGAAAVTTPQMLSGTWRPVKLDGFATLKTARPDDPTLTFAPDGTWTGSDGCNAISGTFSIGQRGEFSSQANGQRLIECQNVPHTGALAAAKRVSSDQTTLHFYASDGREVAIYARAR